MGKRGFIYASDEEEKFYQWVYAGGTERLGLKHPFGGHY